MKKLKFTLVKKGIFQKVIENNLTEQDKNNLMIERTLNIPDFIIGVGLIDVIYNYMNDNNLYNDYDILNYEEVKENDYRIIMTYKGKSAEEVYKAYKKEKEMTK